MISFSPLIINFISSCFTLLMAQCSTMFFCRPLIANCAQKTIPWSRYIPERNLAVLGFAFIFRFALFPVLVLEVNSTSHVLFKIVLSDVPLAKHAIPNPHFFLGGTLGTALATTPRCYSVGGTLPPPHMQSRSGAVIIKNHSTSK